MNNMCVYVYIYIYMHIYIYTTIICGIFYVYNVEGPILPQIMLNFQQQSTMKTGFFCPVFSDAEVSFSSWRAKGPGALHLSKLCTPWMGEFHMYI